MQQLFGDPSSTFSWVSNADAASEVAFSMMAWCFAQTVGLKWCKLHDHVKKTMGCLTCEIDTMMKSHDYLTMPSHFEIKSQISFPEALARFILSWASRWTSGWSSGNMRWHLNHEINSHWKLRIGSLRIRTWRLHKKKNRPSHFKGRIWRSLPWKLHASQGLIQNFFQLCMGGNLRTEHWPMHNDDVHPTSLACISQQQGIYQYFGHQVLVFFQFLKCFPHLFCKI